MLPATHFDLFDKATETLKSSTASTLDSKSKNIIEIKENAIDKNAKTLTDDEYDDEYDYDDGDNDSDEVVPTCKFQFFQFSNCASSIFHESG